MRFSLDILLVQARKSRFVRADLSIGSLRVLKEEFDDALDRIEELEDRIQILEKIGTDEHRKLAQEFNGPKQR